MEITKEEFTKYYSVQMSGVTNMFDVKNIEKLTGLSREKIMHIMDNYSELREKWF